MTQDFPRAAFRIFVVLCFVAVLFYMFRLYTFSYFWLDDFNNLFWVQKTGGWALLWHTLNPFSDFFRPVGMLAYWTLWRLFDLAPLPYHLFALSIHGLNIFLVYLLLKHLLQSPFAAACGAMLFSYQAAYWEIFWSFGLIFELLSGSLFFIGLWIYFRFGDSMKGVLFASAIYILAIKAKEMAITLPVIWLLYEIIVGRRVVFASTLWDKETIRNNLPQLLQLLKRFSIPGVIALWFVYLKVSTMAETGTSSSYYLDFSLHTLMRGYAWYFDAIYDAPLGWMGWIGIAVMAVGLPLLITRDRLALFFLGYIFLSFLPVLPIPNHWAAFFWYIPFFGLCGLVGQMAKEITGWLSKRMSPPRIILVGGLVFALVFYQYFVFQIRWSRPQRDWAREVSQEYRSFILGLRALPQPAPNETVYYGSTPRYFNDNTILSATQVAFRRTDLQARIVEEFSPESRYRVRFENSSVILDESN